MTPEQKRCLIGLSALCAYYRQKNGYTQQQIADELGIHVTTISGFEHGRNNNAYIFNAYMSMFNIPWKKIRKIYDSNIKGGAKHGNR